MFFCWIPIHGNWWGQSAYGRYENLKSFLLIEKSFSILRTSNFSPWWRAKDDHTLWPFETPNFRWTVQHCKPSNLNHQLPNHTSNDCTQSVQNIEKDKRLTCLSQHHSSDLSLFHENYYNCHHCIYFSHCNWHCQWNFPPAHRPDCSHQKLHHRSPRNRSNTAEARQTHHWLYYYLLLPLPFLCAFSGLIWLHRRYRRCHHRCYLCRHCNLSYQTFLPFQDEGKCTLSWVDFAVTSFRIPEQWGFDWWCFICSMCLSQSSSPALLSVVKKTLWSSDDQVGYNTTYNSMIQ